MSPVSHVSPVRHLLRRSRPTPSDAGGPAMRTPSLRRRLTVVVLVLVAVTLGVLGVTTDVVLRGRLDAQLQQRLLDRAQVAAQLADQLDPENLAKRLSDGTVSVLVVDKDGNTYVEGPPPGADPDRVGPAGPGGARSQRPVPTAPVATSTQSQLTEYDDRIEVTREVGDGATLALSASTNEVSRVLDQTRIALLVGALAVLALCGLVVRPVVARTLRPLDRVTALARGIREGDRGSRLRPDRTDTEIGATAHALDDMLDAVEGAESQALEAERRLRVFLSDAAHELRTPIAGLQAASEHLLRSNPPREEREQTLLTLVRESRRAGRLVDDMLLMARIDRGLDLRPRTVDVTAVAASAVEPRRLRHPEATLVVDGPPVTTEADPDRLAQVVGNLVDNAVRAAGPRGHVTVTVANQTGPDVTGSNQKPPNQKPPNEKASNEKPSNETDAGGRAHVVVDVADDGPGIPPADRERVFERLVRLDEARAADGAPSSGGLGAGVGAGLGLAIARGIARAHGGDLVALEPTAGRGALLRLTLPVTSTPPRAGGAAVTPARTTEMLSTPAPTLETPPTSPVQV